MTLISRYYALLILGLVLGLAALRGLPVEERGILVLAVIGPGAEGELLMSPTSGELYLGGLSTVPPKATTFVWSGGEQYFTGDRGRLSLGEGISFSRVGPDAVRVGGRTLRPMESVVLGAQRVANLGVWRREEVGFY